MFQNFFNRNVKKVSKKFCHVKNYSFLCKVINNEKQEIMKTLVIEMENVHTGSLTETKQHYFNITEEKQLEIKSDYINRLANSHLKSDYRLSRIYFKNKNDENKD